MISSIQISGYFSQNSFDRAKIVTAL